MLQKLSSVLKRVLSPSLQAQYKAGFRDDTLELTKKGRFALLEILSQEYDEKFTAAANEVVSEAEAE